MTDTLLFSTLKLSPAFLGNLESLHYREMTPVQAQSLPLILDGRDVKVQAKTGSGKTAAFGIGILQKLDAARYETQSLILCPTRELADQVGKELRRLARPIANVKITTLCGGVPLGPQLASLEHAPHIVVGTPGRLLKHLGKGRLKLSTLHSLVLDEADRMLDMGFLEDIQRIIEQTPTQRQTLLFSATYPDEIESVSRTIQQQPVEIKVEGRHDNTVIKQLFYEVPMQEKSLALMALLNRYTPESTLVFCNRKQQSQELCEELREHGFHALALHGDFEQKDRDCTLVQFSNKSAAILIATDVAARGLDIRELGLVVNYELPPDPEVYVHRIGRTGRAGNVGIAISLFAASEARKVNAIEQYQNSAVQQADAPAYNSTESNHRRPAMVTLCINSGRKNKMRPGDILGALTGNTGLNGDDIGKIDIFDFVSYVAVKQEIAKKALKVLSEGNIKGRRYRARRC